MIVSDLLVYVDNSAQSLVEKNSWLSLQGNPDSVINSVAPNFDLVVMNQADPEDENTTYKYLVNKVLLGSGRPVLVIPSQGVADHIGNRVVIAWDGKREATRAVHDALPFLKSSESVDVISVNPSLD